MRSKKFKAIAISVSTAILGTSSVAGYLVLSNQDDDSAKHQTTTQSKIPTLGADVNNKIGFIADDRSTAQKAIQTSFELPADKANFSYDQIINDIRKLANDGGKQTSTSLQKKEYLVVPDRIWRSKLNVFRERTSTGFNVKGSLRALQHNGISKSSYRYQLKNALLLNVPKDNNSNKKFAAAFSKFLKESQTARVTFAKNEFYEPVRGSRNTVDSKCSLFETMVSSKNPFQSMMGTLYLDINCKSQSFENFDMSSFLTTFFNIGEREVFVTDKPANTLDYDVPVLTEVEAKRLTNNKIHQDKKQIVGTDVVEWLSKMTIDKFGEIPQMFNDISEKLDIEPGEKFLTTINKVIDNNDNIDSKTFSSLSTLFFTIIAGINGASRTARENGILDKDDVSLEDVFPTLISAGESSIKKLIQKIMFGDADYNNFFINNGYSQFRENINLEIKQLSNSYDKAKIEGYQRDLLHFEDELDSTIKDIETLDENNQHIGLDVERELLKEMKAELTIYQSKIFSKEFELTKVVEARYPYKYNQLLGELTDLKEEVGYLKDTITYQQNRVSKLESGDSVSEYDRLSNKIVEFGKKIELIEARIKTLSEAKTKAVSKIKALKNRISLLDTLKNAPNKNKVIESTGTAELISIIFGLVESTMMTTLVDLNLAQKTSTGEIKFKDIDFSINNLEAIRPLFHNKDAISKLNKTITYFNSIVDQFPENTFNSLTKLLYNLIPSEVVELLTKEYNILGKTIKLSEGINIDSDITYGLLTSSSTLLGTGVGAGIGAGLGAFIGGKGGAKIGALAGAGIGTLAGVGVGAGTAYHYFNDGNLNIVAPHKKINDLLNKIKEDKTNGKESTYFNFFTDGHVILKETYLEELNEVFVKMAKSFLYGERELYDYIDNLDKTSKDGFSAWNMVGETLKTFLVSPKNLLKNLKSSSYVSFGETINVFKKEIVDQILNNSSYDTKLIQSLSGITDQSTLTKLQEVHNKVLTWFADASLITKESKLADFGNGELKIGFNPSDISRVDVEELVESFKNVNGVTNEITLVEYSDSDEKTSNYHFNRDGVAVRFDYAAQTDQMLKFNALNKKDQESVITKGHAGSRYANRYSDVNVPIMETKFVVITHRNNYYAFNGNFKHHI